MDWKTFISEVIADLAWPLLILFVIIKFQKPLLNMIGRVKKLQHKDTIIEFANEVRKVQQAIEKSKINTKSIQSDQFSEILKLDKLAPRSAIIEAWLILEAEIDKIYYKHFDNDSYLPIQVKINKLFNKEIINFDACELFTTFHRLRNKAAHIMEFEIPEETLKSYLNSVYIIVEALNKNSDKLIYKR